jgi:hypothetical protein
MVGIFEESLTRGFMLYTLARGFSGMYTKVFSSPRSAFLGFWTSSIILAVLFMLLHTPHGGESPIGLLATFVAALVFSVSIWRTGSLWWTIGLHGAWDWSQSFLYGVADSGFLIDHRLATTHPVGAPLLSGGTTGPEGSIFVILWLAMVALISYLTLPTGGYHAHLQAVGTHAFHHSPHGTTKKGCFTHGFRQQQ